MKYKLFSTLISILLALIIYPYELSATPVLDQDFHTADTVTYGGLGANINSGFRYVAQSFTAGFSGTLTGVTIDVFAFRPVLDPVTDELGPPKPYNLNVAIHTATGQTPTSIVLGSTTLTSPESRLSQLITFPNGIPVVEGNEYAIVVHYPDAPSPPDGVGNWFGVAADRYNGGRLCFANHPAGWSCHADADVFFRTFIDLGSVSYRFVFLADSRSKGSDCNTSSPSTCTNETGLTNILASINQKMPPDFIIFGGDMVWGYNTGPRVKSQLNAWKTIVGNTLFNKLLPVFGGHEKNLRGRCKDNWGTLCNQDNDCPIPRTCITYKGICSNDHDRFCNNNSYCTGTGICEAYPEVWSAFDAVFDTDAINVTGLSCTYFDAADIGDSGTKQQCQNENAEYGHTVYYCDYKNARFFVLNNDFDPFLNTESDIGEEIGSCQKEWVRSKLAGFDKKPLNFFFHHEPHYGTRGVDPKQTPRNAFVEMLACSGLKILSFSGHEHQYTRGTITKDFWQQKAGDTPVCGDSFSQFQEIKAASSGAEWYETGTDPGHLNVSIMQLYDPWYKDTNEPYHYVIVDVVGEEVVTQTIAWNNNAQEDVIINPGLVIMDHSGGPGSISQYIDIDLDGAISSEEGMGDTDGDGISDFEDPDTTRIATSKGGAQVTFDLHEDPNDVIEPDPPVIHNLISVQDTNPIIDQLSKPEKDFIYGMVSADISGIWNGETVKLTLQYPCNVPINSEYFSVGSWQPTPVSSNDGDNEITITITDGDVGDQDGEADGIISHLGGLGFPQKEIINPMVSLAPIGSSFTFTNDTEGCSPDRDYKLGYGGDFDGKFSFAARLTSNSTMSIADLVIPVVELTNGNILQNADSSPSKAKRITVARDNGYDDGKLDFGESVDIQFIICLQEIKPFKFYVDVTGRLMDWGK